MKYAISSDSPFAMFDNQYFWKATGEEDSLTANGMEPTFNELFQETEGHTLKMLQGSGSPNVTTDGWMTKNGERKLTITVHWLDSDFNMTAVVLGAPPITDRSTSEEIARLITERLAKYGLDKVKVSNGCIDQGANYQKALRRIIKFTVLDCICHKLNHVMEDVAADTFSDCDRWASQLVDCCKNILSCRQALENAQIASNRPVRRLKRSGNTRWAYNIAKFQRIIDVWPDLEAAATRDQKILTIWLDNPGQWKLQCIVDVLKTVRSNITFFQAQNTTVIGAVFPSLDGNVSFRQE